MSEARKEIATARLVLIVMSDAALTSDEARDGCLGEVIQCAIPESWPPENWEPHVFEWLRGHFAQGPEQRAWHRYIALREDDGRLVLIGSVGAFTKEPGAAEAEFGYSILPEYQGHGYATEAASALIQEIRRSGRVNGVIAHTFPALVASVRVMEKCGLHFDGEGDEPGTVRYRLRFTGP